MSRSLIEPALPGRGDPFHQSGALAPLRVRRRALLAMAATVAASVAAPRTARAASRIPYGGRVALHVPWSLAAIDPHRIDDAAAAFFGEALFDTLFAPTAGGAVAPSLAESEPELDGGAVRVRLRSGVRFASGSPVNARAVAASIERARARDAAGWLAEVPPARVHGADLVFAVRDPRRLARALSSPLVAVVPLRYVPERPDGTGPFRALLQGGAMHLVRNSLAASGPSFLDAIDLERATDLVTSLRAFESGADDMAWLGSFLHEPRPGTVPFDGGAVAWAVLRTGSEAGRLDAPGSAQALADAVPHASLAALGVGSPWPSGGARWTGPACDLLVRDDDPWLVEVARAVAVALSDAGHTVTARTLAPDEIASRRASRAFALMLDVARPSGPGEVGALLGLAAADDRSAAMALARHPPLGPLSPRTSTRTLRLGVVAEVRLTGGRAMDLVLPPSPWGRGIDWGSAFRLRRAVASVP